MLILKIKVKIIEFLKQLNLIENRTYNSEIELAIMQSKKHRKFIPYKYKPRR